MGSVTVSPKYQVVIPKEVRETLRIKPGQKLHVLVHAGTLRLVPVPAIEDLEGCAKGIPPFEREPDRKL
jgi:AbrB family looped-hinge helix DNA binding protein